MSHIDPERLALFALGEPGATPQESEHLADCPACVDELAALRHAAIAGRATIDIGELEAPPEAVWQRIVAELALSGGAGMPDAGRSDATPAAAPAPEPASPQADRRTTDPSDSAPAPSARPRRVWRGWVLAASLLLVAGIGLGAWVFTQRAQQTEVAEATLAAFPDHPDAEGEAILEERADGSLELRVALDADAAPDTFREVWLITADASALVSLGVLDGREQTFTIPDDVDLREYVLVDVSQEPADGNPDHSGDSIVRGELAFI